MRFTIAALGVAALALAPGSVPGLAVGDGPAPSPGAEIPAPRPPTAALVQAAGSSPPAEQADETLPPAKRQQIVATYCIVCHNDRMKRGNMSLASFDPARPEENAPLAEKIIRKLTAGMMPPPGQRRPEPGVLEDLADAMAARIDRIAAARPNPGERTFQRLNRAEYQRSVRDLLGLEIDAGDYLPPDTVSAGFDNIADVQAMSATLMDGYLRAAGEISRLAVGDPDASPSETTYKAPKTASQMVHVEGTPFGTRGGLAVTHNFPADGDYVFKIQMHPGPTGFLYGMTARDEKLEISVDGERVALLAIDRFMSESDPRGMTIETEPVAVDAGPHRIAAAFLKKSDAPVNDLLAPHEYTLADTMIGAAYGVTTKPHVRDLSIGGPYDPTGVSETPTRRRIFTCRPISPGQEMECAREIVSRLATQAYRRPVTEEEVGDLMGFYEMGATDGNFETGIRMALQAILASPHFVFRLEETPAGVSPGDAYRINDADLASRLSYFLWGSAPDAVLLELVEEGTLSEPEVLRGQVRRMLADPRAEALATRFAAQWLRLQDLESLHPDALAYPDWDHRLSDAMRRETELLFQHLVEEDRSVLELLTADTTFVNERLADHYGIPGVAGTHFRRVEIPDEERRGLLGHGSMLALTSHANRTSPVLRGKWVMEVLLGSPPPPPPPNVPDLEETDAVGEDRLLTVRERLEEHRSNPACRSCHRMMDPIGLALENFDVTGKWRIKDSGVPVDPSGELYDGTPIDGPIDLRNALLERSESFLLNFTENLMAYALGRRVEYFDMPTIRAIVAEAEKNDYRISSFILGIVDSPAFQHNRIDELTDPEVER